MAGVCLQSSIMGVAVVGKQQGDGILRRDLTKQSTGRQETSTWNRPHASRPRCNPNRCHSPRCPWGTWQQSVGPRVWNALAGVDSGNESEGGSSEVTFSSFPADSFEVRSSSLAPSVDSSSSPSLSSPPPPLSPSSSSASSSSSAPSASSGQSREGSPKGGSRKGLFRSPISGGVESATNAHGLPPPAKAVRNLIAQSRYGHLCTTMSKMHHRRRGYPFGSLVDFATDDSGHPLFSLSPLAIHTRNLLADPRCSFVVQTPGLTNLANARMTIFGDVFPLPRDKQDWAQQFYAERHEHGASHQWGNFYFYRMEHIRDIYFVGGFGTVTWVDVKEYASAIPDQVAVNNAEHTIQELNCRFAPDFVQLLGSFAEKAVDDAAIISIDSRGVDVRVQQGTQSNVQRISFLEGNIVEDLPQAVEAVQRILREGLNQTPYH